MSIHIGQSAPDFTLFDSSKNKVSLADYKGRNVVLLFFPLAFSSVCTAELCSVRDNMNKYESLKAEILGISVDSLYTLAKFKSEENLNFLLLSDFNKEVSRAYGTLYANFSYGMREVSKRSAFVIDGAGIIQYAEILENAGEQPNFSAIQQTLSQFNAEALKN